VTFFTYKTIKVLRRSRERTQITLGQFRKSNQTVITKFAVFIGSEDVLGLAFGTLWRRRVPEKKTIGEEGFLMTRESRRIEKEVFLTLTATRFQMVLHLKTILNR
jgi:hypothetical protein